MSKAAVDLSDTLETRYEVDDELEGLHDVYFQPSAHYQQKSQIQISVSVQYSVSQLELSLRLLHHGLLIDFDAWTTQPRSRTDVSERAVRIDVHAPSDWRRPSSTSSTATCLSCLLHRSSDVSRSPAQPVQHPERCATVFEKRLHLPTPFDTPRPPASQGIMAFRFDAIDHAPDEYPYKLSPRDRQSAQ